MEAKTDMTEAKTKRELRAEDVTMAKKDPSLFTVLNVEDKIDKETLQASDANLQFTQLVDPHGNPISITTQDGQNIPVVTNGEEHIIQGLLPDGTLVPINLNDNFIEDTEATQRENISLQIGGSMEALKENVLETNNQTLNSPSIQLITDEDGQEMCLVTYALEEDREAINQALESTIFLEA